MGSLDIDDRKCTIWHLATRVCVQKGYLCEQLPIYIILRIILFMLWLNFYFSVEKPELYENCKELFDSGDKGSLDYAASFSCFIIDYSQSIALTAVNTILPALFTKMIQLEG